MYSQTGPRLQSFGAFRTRETQPADMIGFDVIFQISGDFSGFPALSALPYGHITLILSFSHE